MHAYFFLCAYAQCAGLLPGGAHTLICQLEIINK